jgi:transposase, IS5 family
MPGQRGFWDVEERLGALSRRGNPLEKLQATVDFEMVRPALSRAVGLSARPKGGRPTFDVVLKFRMLVLQALHGLSLDQTEYLGPAPTVVSPVAQSATSHK